MAKKARAAKAKSDPEKTVIEAAMALARERGWRDLTLADIAAEAGMTLSALYPLYPSKGAILTAFARRIDATVLAGGGDAGPDEPARDRLFDVLMRRFDALQPYRPALANIAQDLACDPLEICCGAKRLRRSLAVMLEAAGLSAGGCRGRTRLAGLKAIYLIALGAWFRDESEDLGKTMVALDKALARADSLLARLSRCRTAFCRFGRIPREQAEPGSS